MKRFFRIAIRAAFLVLVAGLLLVGGVLAWFSSWRADRLSHLHAASSVAETSAGKIEFLQSGEGPAVLIFHAAPGGFDQAMLFGHALADAGFQVIAPSRPGYLRTPLATGLTPEKQADAMAALLDSLGVGSVAVLGMSSGAPAAVEFARRYPGRTWAMVLVSPVTKKLAWQAPDLPLPMALNELMTGDVGSWLLGEVADRDPAKALGGTFDLAQVGGPAAREAWVRAVLGRPSQLDWFRDLISTLAPISARENGLKNDLLQLRALAPVAYEELALPALLIHGAEDKWIPLADVEAVAKRLPQATLLDVPSTGHIVPIGPESETLDAGIQEFLNRFHGGQGAP